MKKLILGGSFLMLCLSSFAEARTFTVVEKSIGQNTASQGRFGYNKLGRAWVLVQSESYYATDDYADFDENRYLVQGLSFNTDTQEILYTDVESGAQVICQVKSRPTGKCSLTVKTERREVDNGFETYKENFLVVKMDVPL